MSPFNKISDKFEIWSKRPTQMKGLMNIDLSSIKPNTGIQSSSRLGFPEWISNILPGIRKSSCSSISEGDIWKQDQRDFRRLRSPSDAGDEAIISNDLHSPRPHEPPSDFRGWYKLSLGSVGSAEGDRLQGS